QLPGLRVDDRQAARSGDVDVELLQVPRRSDVLGVGPHLVAADDLERLGVDHLDGPEFAVRYVDPFRITGDRGTEMGGGDRCVHVDRPAGNRVVGGGRLATGRGTRRGGRYRPVGRDTAGRVRAAP